MAERAEAQGWDHPASLGARRDLAPPPPQRRKVPLTDRNVTDAIDEHLDQPVTTDAA
jgi:hypothetical protein